MMLFKVFAYGVGAHIFFSTVCPNEYHVALLNASFYVIFTYSYVELCVKRIYNHPYFSNLKSCIEGMKKKAEIDIIKFNKELVSINRKNITIHHLVLYDFIIFSDYSNDKVKVNKVLYFDFPRFPLDYNYEVCAFSFISINVITGSDKISRPIKLSSDTENYYVVGNKINRFLICYLLNKQHNINCDEVTGSYILEVIDHDVNIKTFYENDEIIFNKNNYTVKPFIASDTSNMTIAEIAEKCNNVSDSKNVCSTITKSDSISE